jgi:prolyl 4-hydroxylase
MQTHEEPCKIMEEFLEPEKCQYIVDTYKDLCKRSTVVDAAGKDVVDPARTSSTYFMPNDDPVIVELRRKAAAMAGVPESHVEGLQLVRYTKGEQYKFHYDYFDAIRHNQREHTFLVYLNEFGWKREVPRFSRITVSKCIRNKAGVYGSRI